MTDADKWELQKLLKESQEELEKLQKENNSLQESHGDLEKQTGEKPLSDVPAMTDEEEGSATEDELKNFKKNYFKLHSEKLILLDMLRERDEQVKQLFEGNKVPVDHPDVSARCIQTPDDPEDEINRLRKVVEERKKKIDLEKQLADLTQKLHASEV